MFQFSSELTSDWARKFKYTSTTTESTRKFKALHIKIAICPEIAENLSSRENSKLYLFDWYSFLVSFELFSWYWCNGWLLWARACWMDVETASKDSKLLAYRIFADFEAAGRSQSAKHKTFSQGDFLVKAQSRVWLPDVAFASEKCLKPKSA